MAARVTVTAGRRGGESAVSRGWRWRLSRSAGERESPDVVILGGKHSHAAFWQWLTKYSDIFLKRSQLCSFLAHYFYHIITRSQVKNTLSSLSYSPILQCPLNRIESTEA